jgi:hypothetical protein
LFTIKVKVFVIGNKASLVCSGEQVGLSKFGCSGSQIKKKKIVEKHGQKEKDYKRK